MGDRWRKAAILAVKGFCMGTADVIPGVSGGTVAFLLRIYSDLIESIRSFDALWVRALLRLDWKEIFGRPRFAFLLPLVTGIACGLMFFTRVISIPRLLQEYPEIVFGLFFGLISGSIIVLLMQHRRWRLGEVLGFAFGLVGGWYVFSAVPQETPTADWFVFLSGALAISAMLLPGISGSFVLLILRKYAYIFDALGYFRFSVLIPFALGILTGLVLFSRILSYLMRHHYRITVCCIIGMLVSSLWVLWPFQQRIYTVISGHSHLLRSVPVLPDSISLLVMQSAGMMTLGVLVVIGMHLFAEYRYGASRAGF